MNTIEEQIDAELEQEFLQLLLSLATVGNANQLFILSPPPTDDPE
jgi:hypothetical protein